MSGRTVAAAPWWLKIPGKLVLSRLPLDYGFWQRLTLFRHGTMDNPSYAFEVFSKHHRRVSPPSGFSALELGPGDTAFSALVARAMGASKTFLVDVGDFAKHDVEPYLEMSRFLRAKGLPAPDLDSALSFEEILERCSARYLTGGVESMNEIPNASIDLSWSQAVLEHVRKSELLPILRELRRVTAPSGGSSHVIDLEDHLAHALNNLRFGEYVWESRLFAQSGFYTNRLRRSQFLELFARAGFDTDVAAEAHWASLPTPRSKMAPEFRPLADQDLCVKELEVVLRPPPVR